MAQVDLPDNVRQLLQSSVPTIDALEVLIFLARHPGRSWLSKEIVDQMQPTVLLEKNVKECLTLFQSQGLGVENPDAGFSYGPTSPDLQAAVAALTTAYNERPVTLIRAVYAIQDRKQIQSFADAFKLKKE